MIQIQVLLACMALLARASRVGDQSAWLSIGRERPWLGTWIVLGVCGVCALSEVVSCARAGRRLDRSGDHRAVLMALRVRTKATGIATIATVGGIVGLGVLDVIRGLLGNVILLDELLALSPLLGVLVIGWWANYPLDRRVREAMLIRTLDAGGAIYPIESRGGHVLLHVRHELLLVLVPISMILGWSEAVSWYETTDPVWITGRGWDEWIYSAVFIGGVVVVLAVTPVLLRLLWDARALGDGEIRERVERACERWGVRVREILLWRTHHSMANAAVMGIFGPMRYILLSDALLEGLDGDQVEAVAAHEVAHIRKRHMPWLAGAVIGPVMLMGSLADVVAGRFDWIDPDGAIFVGGVGGMALVVVLWILGFVSRRFEWQADAFGVRHMSVVAGEEVASEASVLAMSGALARVAALAGLPQSKGSWRHGSIALRRQKLRSLVGVRVDRMAIDRQVARVRLVILGIGIAAAVMAL